MPHIDESTGNIVTRIVYDGAPGAGKTTNLQRLGIDVSAAKLAEVHSPASPGRETEYFDWVVVSGGLIDGRRVTCQVLSVPGQPSRVNRRRFLLQNADAIVFVADSRSSRLELNRRAFTLTRELGRNGEGSGETPFVLLANKQDLDGALAPAALSKELAVASSVPVIGAASVEGRGVAYAFVLAVRLACDSARQKIAQGPLPKMSAEFASSNALLNALVKQEATSVEAIAETRALSDGELNFQLALPSFPHPAQIDSAHIWPRPKGRSILFTCSEARRHVFASSVGGEEMLNVRSQTGWLMQTHPADVFASEVYARAELERVIDACRSNSSWVDEERVVMLSADGPAWRLWTLTRDLPSLSQQLCQASEEEAEEIIALARQADRQLSTNPLLGSLRGRASLDSLAVDKGRIVLQAMRHPPVAAHSLERHALDLQAEILQFKKQ